MRHQSWEEVSTALLLSRTKDCPRVLRKFKKLNKLETNPGIPEANVLLVFVSNVLFLLGCV